jgi:glycyl-tRNA synthetase beta chain
MAELLLEILSEEIPARMQARAAEELKRLVSEKLKDAGLIFSRVDSYVTPRRLALLAEGLPEKQPDIVEEKKGPRVDAPEQAIQGFLKSAGLTSVEQCEVREAGKAQVYFHTVKKPGRATAEVLAELIPAATLALPWPKSMRWGTHQIRFVRPIHGMMAVFGGKALKGTLSLGDADIAFGAATRGHRFLNATGITVRDFADYKAKLHGAKVILDPAERRESIREQAAKRGQSAGLRVKDDAGLLEEVTGLVEWPVVLMGRIDPQFMELPPEVLTASMRAHHKYFSLLNADGALAPHFLVVANIEARDGGQAIVAGNERVLRARLSDAKFFWDLDRKARLEDRVLALRNIVFHQKLGTVGRKVERIAALAVDLVERIPGADRDHVRSGAILAKADLTTGMVGEFPELQGVMGRYYALAQGEKPEVAAAVAEHYSPLGPNDRCPTAPTSVAVALADKLDTLVGFFAIDEKPTGSKDPFALRRAALGVIRLILENNLRLPLRPAIEQALNLYKEILLSSGPIPFGGPTDPKYRTPGEICGELVEFFADRLKVHLREKGVRHDLVNAVFALGGEDDFVRLLARVDALAEFLKSEDGANLLIAYKRAANIVAIEEKKDKKSYGELVDAAKLPEVEERMLMQEMRTASKRFQAALAKEDFAQAMAEMAKLRRPLDAFFDKVTVNTQNPELRENRLRLLSFIRATLNQVADFSKVEG